MKGFESHTSGGGLAPMTVGDLRQALKGIPDDAVVVLSSDAEQNAHHPLMSICTGEGPRGFGLYWSAGRDPWQGGISDIHGGDVIVAGDHQAVLLVPGD